jgi:hypothetical protein
MALFLALIEASDASGTSCGDALLDADILGNSTMVVDVDKLDRECRGGRATKSALQTRLILM